MESLAGPEAVLQTQQSPTSSFQQEPWSMRKTADSVFPPSDIVCMALQRRLQENLAVTGVHWSTSNVLSFP